MERVPYSKLLKDPRWQKVRLLIFQRDNFTCQNKNCRETTKTLNIHHLEYIDGLMPWEYPKDMLITLCEECHDSENRRLLLERHLSTTFKMKGFLLSDLLSFSCKLETDIQFTQTLLNVLRDFQNG